MKISVLICSIFAIITFAKSAKVLIERDAFGIYMCTQKGFSGTCFHEPNLAAGACFDWIWPRGENVNAVGPDQGMLCMIFDALNCSGSRYAVLYPGYADLNTIGWANRVSSFYCVGLAEATARFVSPVGAYENMTAPLTPAVGVAIEPACSSCFDAGVDCRGRAYA